MLKLKQVITKTHLCLLTVIILNLFNSFFELRLNYSFAFWVKIIIYSTGVFLFFLNIRPFKKIALYFSFYVLTPLIVAMFWIFHGIFLGLLSSIFLFPIYPSEVQYEKDNLKVYYKFQGFLGACCTYEITERKFIIFEKHLGEIKYESIDFKKFNLKVENDTVKMTFEVNNYDDKNNKIKSDTLIKQKIK